MGWKDNLISASYRGVNFFVDSSEYTTGRRTELKEFPGQDAPSLQDFGAAAAELDIEGYIISNSKNNYDYFAERDAFIAAFNTIGIGILNHPYYGIIEVYPIERIRISESVKDGGIAQLNMRFVRVNEEEQKLILPSFKKQPPNVTIEALPIDSSDFNSLVDDAVDIARANAADNFFNKFNQARAFANNLKSNILGPIQKIQATVFKIKGSISAVVSQVTGTLSTIISTLDNVIDSPCALFSDILSAGDTFKNICGVELPGVFGGVAGACSGTIRGETTTLTGDTVTSETGSSAIIEGLDLADSLTEDEIPFIPNAQLNNTISSIDAFKFAIYTSVAQVAIRTEFTNQEEAITLADKISNSIDDFLERLGAQVDESGYDYIEGDYLDNTDLYMAMEDLRNVFIQAMYAKANTISSLTFYQVPTDGMTILELAYDKYEDLEREDEIYGMNRLNIRNPGFLPAGNYLRILNE